MLLLKVPLFFGTPSRTKKENESDFLIHISLQHNIVDLDIYYYKFC